VVGDRYKEDELKKIKKQRLEALKKWGSAYVAMLRSVSKKKRAALKRSLFYRGRDYGRENGFLLGKEGKNWLVPVDKG